MNIISLRILFHESLNTLYDNKERDTLFYMFCETLLNLQPHQLLLHLDTTLSTQQQKECINALVRLKNAEPIQYVLGTVHFMGLNFQVNPHVLIPRPETEELVDLILKEHQTLNSPLTLLDVGTGSGCIAITLAKKQPFFQVSALEVSYDALKVAQNNAQHLKAPVTYSHQDILAVDNLENHYDIMVSNPPYVCRSEQKDIKPNVLHFEPHQALFVEDTDPLIFYRQIIALACKNTYLYFEINPLCVKEMEETLLLGRVQAYQFFQDFRGKTRFLKIIK